MNQAPELISPLDLWRQHEDIEIKSKIDERVFTDWRINQLHNKHCSVSAKFGPLMIFSKRWFAYNKITQGDMHEYKEEARA